MGDQCLAGPASGGYEVETRRRLIEAGMIGFGAELPVLQALRSGEYSSDCGHY